MKVLFLLLQEIGMVKPCITLPEVFVLRRPACNLHVNCKAHHNSWYSQYYISTATFHRKKNSPVDQTTIRTLKLITTFKFISSGELPLVSAGHPHLTWKYSLLEYLVYLMIVMWWSDEKSSEFFFLVLDTNICLHWIQISDSGSEYRVSKCGQLKWIKSFTITIVLGTG